MCVSRALKNIRHCPATVLPYVTFTQVQGYVRSDDEIHGILVEEEMAKKRKGDEHRDRGREKRDREQ